jgi:hypothetical protein
MTEWTDSPRQDEARSVLLEPLPGEASDTPSRSVEPAPRPLAVSWRDYILARVLVVGLLVLVTYVYCWYATAGKLHHDGGAMARGWSGWSLYYNMMADGFSNYRTSLLVDPEPALLALPDPYDPGAGAEFKVHDLVLYSKKYYTAWGPVPAILVMISRHMPEPVRPPTTDQHLTLYFTVAMVTIASAMLLYVRERWFTNSLPWYTVGFGVVAVGLVNPILYTLSRPMVYEASILGGQAFLMLGAYASVRAMDRWTPVDTTSGQRWIPDLRLASWLALAGCAFIGAVGTRASLGLAVVGATCVIGLFALVRTVQRRRAGEDRAVARGFVTYGAFLLPIVIGTVALLWFNAARFGNPFEFGTAFQLSGVNGPKLRASGELLSRTYAKPSLHRYLWDRADVVDRFPFVVAVPVSPTWHDEHKMRPNYGGEPVVGTLIASPVLWLAFVTGLAVVGALVFARAAPVETWLTVLLATTLSLSVARVLCTSGSSMRYELDAVPAASVLAVLGAWQLARVLRRGSWAMYALVTTTTVLTVISLFASGVLGLSGYGDNFKNNNPDLYQWMSDFFS